MAELEDYQLVALCDLNEELAKTTAEKFPGAKAYTDMTAMLKAEKPDVVAIATPNDSHAKLTIQVAEFGVKGICCEKPMSVSLGEAKAWWPRARRTAPS